MKGKIAMLGLVGLLGCDKESEIRVNGIDRILPNELKNSNFVLERYVIPTKGNVTDIHLLSDEKYEVLINGDEVSISGKIGYHIRPDVTLLPNYSHDRPDLASALVTMPAENSGYWDDVRLGSLVLVRK